MLLAESPWPELPDEEILERIRGGDRVLYSILAERHNRRLNSVACAILQNQDEAEDVVQDTHLRALVHLDQLRDLSGFRTWLTRIVVNESMNRIRARRRLQIIDSVSSAGKPAKFEPVSHASRPDQQVADRELGSAVRTAVKGLPERYRTAFMLRTVEEMSTAETAARLGISEECVKSRMHRARRLLRSQLVSFRASAAIRKRNLS